MEDLEIIEETSLSEDYRSVLSSKQLRDRKLVWQAMSEVWLHEEICDYDLNYIAIRLSDSPYKISEIRDIFEEEVRPVVETGQYIMNNEWYVIEANWLEDSILKYIYEKQIALEQQSLPTKIFKKFGLGKKKADDLSGQEAKVRLVWDRIERLVEAMRQSAAESSKPAQITHQPSVMPLRKTYL